MASLGSSLGSLRGRSHSLGSGVGVGTVVDRLVLGSCAISGGGSSSLSGSGSTWGLCSLVITRRRSKVLKSGIEFFLLILGLGDKVSTRSLSSLSGAGGLSSLSWARNRGSGGRFRSLGSLGSARSSGANSLGSCHRSGWVPVSQGHGKFGWTISCSLGLGLCVSGGTCSLCRTESSGTKV